MRLSQFHLATEKEVPADAEVVSHKLMLRAGMIRRLAAGIYVWTPLGLRVLRNVERIVREEMNAAGALELLMPAVQPAELWEESRRWDKYGPELLRITDRHDRRFAFGPTHEEVITELARNEIRSYRQLPVNFYQIQTKFRDEIRPRFGVMRSREFIMKDAYSFHLSEECLRENGYRVMFEAYRRIFDRIGLEYRPVAADSGAIGGNRSHEFHVLADSGEDAIAFSSAGDYAANVELAEALAPSEPGGQPSQALEHVATPNARTIEEVSALLEVDPAGCVKTLVVETADGELYAVVVRGDHQLNEIKLGKLGPFREGFRFAGADTVQKRVSAPVGFLGPVGLNIPVIVDRAAAALADFVCGANQKDTHYRGANWERDASIQEVADIRNVVAGDPSPDGGGTLEIARGIEVGHVFQLGTEYSESMHAVVLDENGKAQPMFMGCYGIGVTRIVAAAIEQNHDDRGIIWPAAIAPFRIALLPMNLHKSHRVREAANGIYEQLMQAGYDVLYDDRKVRPGVMFAESELIGIPHRIIVGERGLDEGQVEIKSRRGEEGSLPLEGLVEALASALSGS